MKSSKSILIILIALVAVALPVPLAAQHTRYKLIDLGTLGGPNSYVEVSGDLPIVLNNRGTVVGCADTPAQDPNGPNSIPLLNLPDPSDPFIFHSFEWSKGALTDLGVLPGGYSSCATWISGNGLITGMSTTGDFDPFMGGPASHAVLWKDGEIVDVGTFGGAESLALGVNTKGQVAGSATNTIPDDVSGFGTQLRAFRWQNGLLQDLGTLGGSNAFATSINESGEVAGCANTDSISQNAFLWKNGTMIDLGSFGGSYACAFQVNNHGQVMGLSTLPGDQVQRAFFGDHEGLTDLGTFGGSVVEPFWLTENGDVVGGADYPGDMIRHAFLWKKGVMSDLGTTYHECSTSGSVALGVNSKVQIVGNSWCDDIAAAGFLWENGGPMVDLNTLVSSNAGMYLFGAQNINDRGEISGLGFLPESGEVHGFLLIPCGEGTAGCGNQTEGAEVRRKVILPENVRKLLRRRMGFGRFLGTPQKVALSGAAAISGPNATLSPTSLTFSTQAIGTTSAAKTVTLKNTGTTSLTISSIAITGTNAGNFAQTHTCGSSLAAGASCTVSVTFKPTASGTRTAALSITDNASGSPQKVTLSGIGTTAKLSPKSLTFSAQLVGTTSPAKTVTLTNVGTTSLSITGIAITGTNPRNFAQTHTCGSSLAAGASCTMRVTFKPTTSGLRSAALSVSDSAAGSPQIASLSGTGVVSGPNATLSPTSVTFAAQLVGTTSPGKSVTLTNFGSTTLSITSITASGDFSQTHSCGSSVAPLASCTISVTFKPTQIGTRTGTLSIADNAPGSPQSVALSATGVVSGPNATLSPTSLIFACRNIIGDGCGCHTLATPTLTNFGSTTLSITGIGITGAAFSETNNCDTNLGAGKSCTITVKWMPPSSSFSFGTVSVSDNASGSPQTVSLEGLKECTPP